MNSAPDIISGIAVLLFLSIVAFAILYRLWKTAGFLPQRKLLMPFNLGVVMRGKQVSRVVEPGHFWLQPGESVLAVDTRPRPFRLAPRDLPAADTQWLRVGINGEIRVSDAVAFVQGSTDGHGAMVLEIEREVTRVVAEATGAELIASKQDAARRLLERVEPGAAHLGVRVSLLEVTDLVPLGWPRSQDN